MFLFNKKNDVFGIDIGSTSVKLVQLKELKEGWQLVSAGMIPLAADVIVDNTIMDRAAVVSAIRLLTSNLAVSAKDACCSISGNSVIIRKIQLSFMGEDELEEQIAWEAEQYIPFDIKDVNLDFQVLSADTYDPSKMNVLLVASKKEIVNDYVSIFSEAGIGLAVIDVDPFAVQNCFELNAEGSLDDMVALVNIGANTMSINVVKSGSSLFARDVQMGGGLYNEEIQRQMGLSSEDAESLKVLAGNISNDNLLRIIAKVNENIVQEIRRSLEYFQSSSNEDKIKKIIFSGGCAKAYGLRDAVEERLGLPVELLNPFAKIMVSDKDFDPEYIKEIGPFAAVAVGLATRKAGDK